MQQATCNKVLSKKPVTSYFLLVTEVTGRSFLW